MRNLRTVLRPRLATSLTGWAAVVVLLAGSAVAGYQSRDAAIALTDATLKRERAEVERARLARTVTRVSPEQARHWQTVNVEIEFPWDNFFEAVERTSNPDIELLEMVPDKTQRLMVLRGEARNSAALIKYVEALAGQSSLRDVFVARLQNIERGSLLTVEFEIRMSVI